MLAAGGQMRIPSVKLGQNGLMQVAGQSSLAASFERILEQVQATGVQDLEQFGQLASLAQLRMVQALMTAFDDEAPPAGAMPLMAVRPPVVDSECASAGVVRVSQAASGVDDLIEKAAETHGVDEDLIRAVIRAESGFNPRATSPKGAMGLMQLMPATARSLGVSDAYDPEQNIMAGTRFLKSLLNRYEGDVGRALAAYNWGPGNVERHPDRLPRETRNYIARITADYRKS
jgi:soluble lytic murein transglycosylase-like protein